MICEYSEVFKLEWKKYNLEVIEMDNDFELKQSEMIESLIWKL
jgi:hypothetical protein